MQAVQKFVDETDKLARKHNAKVSISVPGEKEVVIADHTDKGDANVLLSLESLIQSHYQGIERLKDEKKKKAEMLKDAVESDAVYHEQAEKVKEAKKLADATKATILSAPANFQLKQEVKDITQEMKEKKEALSEYLLEYIRISGATQLELFPGEFVDIVLSAKVKKQSKRRN